MTRPTRDQAEARARTGFALIAATRFGGVALVMLGFAIVRRVIDLPYALGAAIVVAGFFGIFFLPRFIARRFRHGSGRGR